MTRPGLAESLVMPAKLSHRTRQMIAVLRDAPDFVPVVEPRRSYCPVCGSLTSTETGIVCSRCTVRPSPSRPHEATTPVAIIKADGAVVEFDTDAVTVQVRTVRP